jgi:hypothetical protein
MEQHHSHHHPYFGGGTTALIYSEPALPSATMANAPTIMNTTPTWAYSDMALPQVLTRNMGQEIDWAFIMILIEGI